ncbi:MULTISPECIES: Crp/Fnr family transcriptional regulator [Paraburkholderia]|uniref:Crp/Fnr family transcriptional regulator n=1 Tax=Paraburkholderia TaxID=1822464 RepID=UPI00197F26C5|nr:MULTISPECIES: Crp/Fnr family transcriptional regulator [Paraburkholderia]MBN3809900.1 Crp/Fnr family transcriptional regulator [Paraburkholderia sp. Ac-20347]
MNHSQRQLLTAVRPSIFAAPFDDNGDGSAVELLSAAEQDALMQVSELIEIPRNSLLYSEREASRFVYNIVTGVAETYRIEPEGVRCVTAFLFPHDLIGLSADGFYVSTAKALTPLSVFRIPISDLKAILERDPRLDIGLLCKLCHELRHSQYHAIMVSKRDASVRVARFLLWIQQANFDQVEGRSTIVLPMSRQEVADYVGLSIEAVSRGLHFLEEEGAVTRDGPRLISVKDPVKLSLLAGHVPTVASPVPPGSFR